MTVSADSLSDRSGEASEDRIQAAETLIAAVLRRDGLRDGELADIIARLDLGEDAVAPLTHRLSRAREDAAGLRRRDRELVAVAESARALANATSVEETLDDLVRAAHSLVVADIAYLSEYYPDTAELRVRATRGVTQSAFADLPVPTGIGLASRIAQTRQPEAVEDYFDDHGLMRSDSMDSAVRDEGVVSLVGVPLLSNSTVLGVLFVGTRTRHVYAPDEIAILSALADHAAIALLRALRFGDLRRTGDEAAARAAAWEQYFRDQRRVLDVVDQLFDAVLSGAGIHEVIGALSSAVARDLVFLDESGGVIAGSTSAVAAEYEEPAALSPSAAGSGATFAPTPDSPTAEAVVTVDTRTEGLLRLHVLRPRPGSPLLDPETVTRGAQVCGFAWLLASATRLQEDRRSEMLIADLLTPTGASPAGITGELAAAGLPLADIDHLFVLRGAIADLRAAAAALDARASARSGLVVGMHGGELCVLCDASAVEPVRAALERTTAARPGLAAMATSVRSEAAGAGPRLDPLRSAHRSAVDLLAVVGVLEWSGHVVDAAELQPYALLIGADRRALDAFIRTAIGPLVDADEQGDGRGLIAMLETYFRSGRSLRATAEATSFHVNTVTQRLRRVDALLGPAWRTSDRAFLVEAAVRLRRVDRALRRPPSTLAAPVSVADPW